MFTDKTIFLITPQPWKSNGVSKHHYAQTLAKNGNTVYYIDPPIRGRFNGSISFKEIKNELHLVSIFVPIPNWMRFKFPRLYSKLVRYQFKRLIAKVGIPDILWNFDNETYFEYEDLFKESFRIFHPVDQFVVSPVKKYHELYDIAFSISPDLLSHVTVKQKHFINHGLNEMFVTEASKALENTVESPKNTPIKAGYVGNLSIRFLDREVLKNTIVNNPEVEFNFIGNHEEKDDIISILKPYKNVKLLGPIHGPKLYTELRSMDLVFVCYKKQYGFLGDNSHKMMEYLSTGKPIVTTYLSVYQDSDMISMSKEKDNSDFVDVFQHVVRDIGEYQNLEMEHERIQFALSHSYDKNLEQISKCLPFD